MIEVIGYRLYKVKLDPDKGTKITEKYVKGVTKNKTYTETLFKELSKRLRRIALLQGVRVDFHFRNLRCVK